MPYDLNCASGATCATHGPSNWSTVRLTSITTRQYSVAASAYQNVDSYALNQTEPPTGDGTSPTLWLASVTRTGDDTSDGGSSSPVTLPAESFTGTDLADRVDTTNFPGLYRYRITSITNEMGGVTGVSYGTPDACTASYVQGITTNAAAASNAKSCYPVWWTPPGYVAPVMDWFEKYAVTQVLNNDTTGGALAEQTDYSYGGGAAWHYDDNEVVKAKYRGYGQFRGYGSVTTYTGDGVDDPQTEQVTSYYRGMSDDNNSTAVTLTDSQGGTHDDANVLAGLSLETTAYNGKGGPVDQSTITSYWVSAAAASRARPGLPALTANMVAPCRDLDPAGADRRRRHLLAGHRDRHHLQHDHQQRVLRPAQLRLQPHGARQPGLCPVHRHQLCPGQHRGEPGRPARHGRNRLRRVRRVH